MTRLSMFARQLGRFSCVRNISNKVPKRNHYNTTDPTSHVSIDVSLSEIPASTVSHLRMHGYAVLDSFAAPSTCESFISEIDNLISDGHGKPNATHILHGQSKVSYAKSGVFECELSTLSTSVLSKSPYLESLHHDTSMNAYLSVHWPALTLRDSSVKVLRSEPNACFPVHVDSSASFDTRVVTAVLYPHTEWEASDGGQLRLYPTPLKHVDIDPLPGRLVLTAARGLHHRVLPTNRIRHAVTLWLSGSLNMKTNIDVPLADGLSLQAMAAACLLTPRFRDFAFRIALEEEWMRSLMESHGKQEVKVLMEDFKDGMEKIRRLVPDAVCQLMGVVDDVKQEEIRELVNDSQRLRDAFHELQETSGQLQFYW